MLSYCLKCKNKKKTKKNTSNGKTMTLSKCAICDSKKRKFVKK